MLAGSCHTSSTSMKISFWLCCTASRSSTPPDPPAEPGWRIAGVEWTRCRRAGATIRRSCGNPKSCAAPGHISWKECITLVHHSLECMQGGWATL